MKETLGVLAAAVLAAILCGSSAWAATYTATWVGGGDNLWNNAAQWTPTTRYPNNGQPGGSDTYDVVINGGASTLALNQSVAVEVFYFNGGSIRGFPEGC